MKIIGYAPDLEPTTPGALREVENIIPTVRGMEAAPSSVNESSALSAAANSLATIQKLDGTKRVLAGTASTIEELASGAWTDRSDVGGYTMNGRWVFDQFGDVTLASCKAETLQASASGAFAAVSGAPKAKGMAVNQGFVMLANYNDGSDTPDGWFCSAYLDYTDWTPAISTQCTKGRIVDAPGAFTACHAFGDGFVLYKDESIHLGTYVGAPSVFNFNQIPGKVGVASQHCVVNIGSRHIIVAKDDIYSFDGSRPISISGPIREWFFADLNRENEDRTIVTYNYQTGNVWIWYCSNSNSGTDPDKAIVYNVRTQKWGKVTKNIEAASTYYTAGITWDGLGSEYSTFNDLPNDTYDSAFSSNAAPESSVVETDHKLYTLTGAANQSSITLNNLGDDRLFTTISRVWPRFTTDPQSSTLDYSYDYEHGDSFTYKGTYNYISGRYDLLNSSRWHQCKLNFSGPMEITEVKIDLIQDGIE